MLKRIVAWFPLTPAGLVAMAASLVAVMYYGWVRLDRVLMAVGWVGITLVGVGVISVVLAALVARAEARRAPSAGEPLRVECGVQVATGFSVKRRWWLPVSVRWSWSEPRVAVALRRERGRLHEDITPTHRDRFDGIARRFEIVDAFGLARIAFVVRQGRPGRFAPSVGGLAHMQVAQGLAGGDTTSMPEGTPTGDYYDMRGYGPGDPIRFILWKVFARTRELLVRTPEPATSPDRRTIAYLVVGQGDEPGAGAARVAVESGALGRDWLLGADGCPDPAASREDAIDLLARSARANPDDGGGLGGFLQRAEAVSRTLVFVPARPGPWLDRVARAAAATPGRSSRVEFVVCIDGVAAEAKTTRWARLLAPPRIAGDAGTHTDLLAVLDALGKTGANILVADRPGGRILPARTFRGTA